MVLTKIADYLASNKQVNGIMAQPADLSEFRERPTPRLIAGLSLMILSFILGWPAVAVLSVLAVWFRQPLLFVIGGPLTYGFSYVVFIVGAWLSRAPHYMGVLLRYCMQKILRKMLSWKGSQ